MTISSENRKAGPYTGNGVTTEFAFTFRVFSVNDIQVVLTDAAGIETVLTLDSDYAVDLNEDQSVSAGGVIIYPHPTAIIPLPPNLPSTKTLTIVGDIDYTQGLDLTNGGAFNADNIEASLDKLTMQVQQVKEIADRAIKIDVSSTDDPDDLLNSVYAAETSAVAAASAASGSQTAAAASALAASNSATNALNSANAADASADAAAASQSAAAGSAVAADASADAAAASALAASGDADDAAASAALANDWATKTASPVAGGEYSAKYHAIAAASSASSADSAKTAAQAAQTAAESARDTTLAAYDSFDDRYLGAKTSNPTLDNDGNALQGGALYFNTSAGEMRIYTGSAWVAAYVSGTSFVIKSGDTMTGDLSFSGTGLRIKGDFSNATLSSRLMFQTSITNGATGVYAIPNGTGSTSGYAGFNNVDPANAAFLYFGIGSTYAEISSGKTGTGTALPLLFGVNGTEWMRLTTAGALGFNGANYGAAGEVLISQGPSAPPVWGSGGFPSGTRMAFQQTAAPTGWTKDTTAAIDDSILRLVTGSVSSGGSTAFSTFNAQTSVGATTLSTTQIPSHTHSLTAVSGKTGSTGVQRSYEGGSFTTGATGGGGSHNHSITTSIKYYDFIIASKN